MEDLEWNIYGKEWQELSFAILRDPLLLMKWSSWLNGSKAKWKHIVPLFDHNSEDEVKHSNKVSRFPNTAKEIADNITL